MSRLLLILFLIGGFLMLLNAVLKIAGIALLGLLGISLSALLIWGLYCIARSVYHAFNPKAKQAYIAAQQQKAADARVAEEQQAAIAASKEQAAREARRAIEVEQARALKDSQFHRDADSHHEPYTYTVGLHANEALAIRYGIANQRKTVKEYYYFAHGGDRRRNSERDTIHFKPALTIKLKKLRKIHNDIYEVALSDFRDRRAKVVIEKGTEYVKTFLPMDESWFEKHADLELTLKGNGSFGLKQLAEFHVHKAVK